MTIPDSDSLRFPIGRFVKPSNPTTTDVEHWITVLEETPMRLRHLIHGLSDAQIDTPYRPGGWTVRQVVHHLPDSHMNSYVRFKLALTEDKPVVKPYAEERWAELHDARTGPVELSLALLEAIHKRWTYFLRSLSEDDWKRTFIHPEANKVYDLKTVLALYAWHSEHHLAHIRQLKFREGW